MPRKRHCCAGLPANWTCCLCSIPEDRKEQPESNKFGADDGMAVEEVVKETGVEGYD